MPDPTAALSPAQRATLDAYVGELARVNRRVNLVARGATPGDLARHVRHCLEIAARPFPGGAVVVDWGTGGGLPALPLAVAFPDVRFVAVDAVGKKTEAVRLFARRLGVENVEVWNGRAEAYDGPAPHYAVSRATAPLADLWAWFDRVRAPLSAPPEAWAPGLVCLKGGDLTAEINGLQDAFPSTSVDVQEVEGAGWDDKALVHVV
ncbi:RsmG family class I SAM-dependent methyltransferase [Rubrivirga sp. S365]|uniref:Ribosomal RNA small subunit methyltransferase G n=1 Tax=Rubrivirga litoralis TaxID=3075598 RepID=A0ABU3BM16_9BACT|nr:MULTISPECIES: RsmG family class I SAM-dependent methyltransferase [unclassified Rubrivirga]MDT0630330.1 RsmG family class I SAM-dependent methyltransferase [Rubrivirga sp. F394]MDT7855842.1 RsmG family class I SAM-dependent methyltransferase [Rubrivirga sp. S365]